MKSGTSPIAPATAISTGTYGSGREKQHRNDHELLGHHESHAELEAHLRHRGVSEQEARDEERADVALRWQQQGDQDRGDAVAPKTATTVRS